MAGIPSTSRVQTSRGLDARTYREHVITPDREGAAYRQLASLLRDRICGGELEPGQRMPSEKDLHDEYGLARETVRRALAVLRAEGLIEIRHGRGTLSPRRPGGSNSDPATPPPPRPQSRSLALTATSS